MNPLAFGLHALLKPSDESYRLSGIALGWRAAALPPARGAIDLMTLCGLRTVDAFRAAVAGDWLPRNANRPPRQPRVEAAYQFAPDVSRPHPSCPLNPSRYYARLASSRPRFSKY